MIKRHPSSAAFTRRIIPRISLVLSLLLLCAWLCGLWRYTSFGIDSDQLVGSQVHARYVRIRWPGDGSLWFGGGAFVGDSAGFTVQPFDLGGAFLLAPRAPVPETIWNRIGFWWVHMQDKANGVSERWLGIPGWLPILFTSLPLWWGRARGMLRR